MVVGIPLLLMENLGVWSLGPGGGSWGPLSASSIARIVSSSAIPLAGGRVKKFANSLASERGCSFVSLIGTNSSGAKHLHTGYTGKRDSCADLKVSRLGA